MNTNCSCGLCVPLVPERLAVVILEESDATVIRARDPERRAALEEAVLFAYAAGERERVSLLGGELAQLVAVGSA